MLPRTGEGSAHLPTPPPRPPGYWQRHAVEFPDPPTPFWAAWVLPVHNAALRTALTDLGLLVDRVEYREIEGYVYRRVVPFGLQRMPPLLLRPIYRALVRMQPASRKRLNVAIHAARSHAWEETLTRWRQEWLPRLRAQRDAIDLTPAPDADDAALDQFAEEALRSGHEAVRLRCRVLVASALVLGREAPGGDEPGSVSAAAQQVRPHLAAHDPIAGEPIVSDVSAPYEEAVGTDGIPGARASVSEAATHLAQSAEIAFRPPYARELAERLGRRLQQRELLSAEQDVYFLTLDEARAALRSGAPVADVATRRREAWQQSRTARPVESFGGPPSEQPLALYPAAAAVTTTALLRGLKLLWEPGPV